MRTKSNAKTEVDEKNVDEELKNGIIPDDEDEQIRQIEAIIKKERQEGIDYPFTFIQGKMIRSGQNANASDEKLTPKEIIKAEL